MLSRLGRLFSLWLYGRLFLNGCLSFGHVGIGGFLLHIEGLLRLIGRHCCIIAFTKLCFHLLRVIFGIIGSLFYALAATALGSIVGIVALRLFGFGLCLGRL